MSFLVKLTRTRRCKQGDVGVIGCHEEDQAVPKFAHNLNSTFQTGDCNREFCPITPTSQLWTAWTECTRKCDGGKRMRAALKCTEKQTDKVISKNKSKKEKKKNKGKSRREADDIESDLLEFLDEIDNANETALEPPCLPPAELRNFNETEKCNLQPCAKWALWSPWESCSATCGKESTKSRNRVCRFGEVGEAENCPSEDATETVACDLDDCPYLGEWGSWSDYSKTCGSGEMTRKKPCFNGIIGQVGCESANATEQIPCATHYCPIFWGEWSEYSECSHSCSKGVRVKSRVCQNELIDVTCPGSKNETQECFEGYCSGGSFSPEWASWGEWGECSTTCGPGLKSRRRTCTGDIVGSVSCPYDDEQQTGKCEIHGCPQWSLWNSWQPCDLDCEDPEVTSRFLTGSRTRRRDCVECPMDTFVCVKPSNFTVCKDFWELNNLAAIEKEEECRCKNVEEGSSEGSGNEIIVEIETTTQPVVTTVSVSYDLNFENFFDVQPINEAPQAFWGSWMEWTKCSKTCDLGERVRYRPCTNANIGELKCPLQESMEKKECKINLCRGEWLDWGSWGKCSASCDNGVRSRTRNCKDKNKFGYPGCQKKAAIEMEKCSDRPCSYWNDWTTWSRCSSSCGGGVSTRMRNCDTDENIEINCAGNSLESKACFIPEEDCLADIEEVNWMPERMLDFGPAEIIPYSFTSSTSTTIILVTTSKTTTTSATTSSTTVTTAVTWTWADWTNWSQCTLPCDDTFSRSFRTRTCISGDCPNDPIESRICTDEAFCDYMDADSSLSDIGIDYSFDEDLDKELISPPSNTIAPSRPRIIWQQWGPWTPCDRTCDEGHRERFRTCDNRELCPTGSYETEECDLGYCARMTGWSVWSPCSASCGKGNLRTRKNYCDRVGNDGKVCPEVKNMTDVLVETEPCLSTECPYFAQWSVWSVCEFDGPCPFTGGKNRTRKCNFGSVGDEGCKGDLIELDICHHENCGYWSEWEPWSECTATCDAGERARQRSCVNGKKGDVGCPYDEETDLERCNNQACPKWSVWSSWSECETECGPSLSTKSRVCLGAPFGSDECPGLSEKIKSCESKCIASQKCEENICVCNEGAGWILDTEAEKCVRPQPCLECHYYAVCNVDICFDYNECALKLHNCDELAKCKNTEGGYECICPKGFESDVSGSACLDINECSRGIHNCHAPEDWAATGEETRVKYGLYSSTCTNIIGGFECECLAPEFYGNGTHCEQAAPSIMAAAVYQVGKKLLVEDNARRTIDIDTCGAIGGVIEVSVILAGKPPFNIEVDTIANPYAVTALNNVIFDSPFEMKLRIEGITSEPTNVDDQIYLVNVSDYQYSTELKGGDLPIKANTTTQFQLRIGNRKCLQLSKFSKAKSVNADPLLYQKFIITIKKPSSSPIFGHIIKKLHLLSESFFQSDFRFLATETIGIRSIGNETSIDSVFVFESDDSATNAKSVAEITQDFIDIFTEYIIEEFALGKESVRAELVGEAASPSGIYLILLTAVFGVIIISASSFISFCTWPTNFTVLNESGRTEADSQSVVSFLSGPLVMLLEASVTSWVWVDYNSFGAEFLTKSDALGTALLIRKKFKIKFT
ncbi:unnamed protein product [Oikopleura dioica]|uniref:EGF-like domain-containing protein n=1 Tax=Oikopleura dioica TaxID=34765 RepID=E4WVR9_OIKDI|nr:unnamed protein product [Oikopleura dioica]